MEYVYAALILHETDTEINEENLSAVLESVGITPDQSRIKALVAALEDVDVEEAIESAEAVPAGGAAPPAEAEAAEAEEEAPEEAETAEAEEEAPDEEEEVSGEGLGDLFG